MVTVDFDSRVSRLGEEAKARYGEAMEILAKADCGAEDLEKAEKLRGEAQRLRDQASQLVKLKLESAQVEGLNPVNGGGQKSQTDEFSNWTDFVGAMARQVKSKGRDIDPRLKKDLNGLSGSSGGYLIPTQMINQLMAVAAPISVVRPRATVISLTGRDIEIPTVDQTQLPAGQTPFFGGVDTFWQSEGSAITATEPRFRQAKLVAHELVGRTVINNSLLEDAPALASFLASVRGFPGAIAWREDTSFLRGDGVGKPLGVVNAPATSVVSRTTAGQIVYDDLANMEGRFMGEQGVWVASIHAKARLLLMNGPAGNPAYLWGSARDGVPNTLMGRPILFTDKLPAVGTRGDIVLCDFTYYLIADRNNSQSVESDESQLFSFNKTVMRIVHRVDGQPWLSAPIVFDGTNEISPFVVLS